MKNIKIKVTDEVHKILIDYKLDNKLKNLDEAITKILKSLKGGKRQ